MTGIIIVGAIGLICAILLVVASHFLSVPIDTRVEDIRGFLPGANCGACGYAGCDDYAKAVANGSAKLNLCIPGGASVSAQISEYLGVAAENTEPVKATVRCSGTCEKCGEAEDYHGPATCAACAALHRGKKACVYGCLGYGDCVKVCKFGALSIVDGVAHVDESLCTGCGACMDKCPAKKTPDKFNEFVGPTTAINIPFPQAIPKKATINAEFCRKLTSGKCGVCAKVCPTGAINYEMKDEEVTETVGAIVAATGYDLMDWTVYGEYGAGQYPDVITSLQYERIMSASGPTGGHIKRPSDGKEPKSVVFIQCVGSRDKSIGRPYCSGFCCMYTAKQAVLTKDHIPTSQSYVFYMDIRAPSKLYDEFTRRAIEEYGTEYIRGRVSAIQPDGHGQYIVRGADTLLGKPVEVKADMVVLAVGIEGSKGANKLAETLHISYDGFGFFMESHCKLRPVETNTAGVFLAGVCQGTKDIPSSVSQGSAAAAKVLALFARDKLENDPQIAQVDNKRCVACGKCIRCCPFGAITAAKEG